MVIWRSKWRATTDELAQYKAIIAEQERLDQQREKWWLTLRNRLAIPDDVDIRIDPVTGVVKRVRI